MELCEDGSPRGFAVMTFEGNRVADYYYKGTRQERTFQMKLYDANDYQNLYELDDNTGKPIGSKPAFADYAGKIIITIFACDERGSIRAREDGGEWKDIRSSLTRWYDPDAFKEVEGPNLPVGRGSSEPFASKVLYSYTPTSPEWKKIEAEYTDPYGNVYTGSIVNE